MARSKHSSRTRKGDSKKPARKHPRFSIAQKVVLVIICLTFCIVTAFTIFALNYTPENRAMAKISRLVSAYYETYYYPNAFGDDTNQAARFLSRYAEKGLTTVNLRQLALLTPNVSPKNRTYIRHFCNENATYVRYFPEPPYTIDSYRTEIHYACNFD